MHKYNLSGVSLRETRFNGKTAVALSMAKEANQDPGTEALVDRNYLAWLDVSFSDGEIEVEVASVLADHAPAYARGFIGLTFRNDANRSFESVYLRPLNSRVDDQVRRNRSVQYVAYPDFTFPRLRADEPGRYETYADLPMADWIRMRLTVRSKQAKLYLDGNVQPTLVVNDLKLGEHRSGGVGLWIEAGTVGHFANLHINGYRA